MVFNILIIISFTLSYLSKRIIKIIYITMALCYIHYKIYEMLDYLSIEIRGVNGLELPLAGL